MGTVIQHPRAHPRRGGFTLIETAIASSLVAMGAISAALLLGSLARANSLSVSMSEGSFLAQEKLEELKAGTYDQIMAGSDLVGSFSRAWSVSENLVPRYKAVQLTVGWTDVDGNPHALRFKTIRAKDAL